MLEVGEDFLQVEDEVTNLSGLYDDVINVDFQIVPNLPLKIGLHTPLVGGPHVL
jgi:hypothetical protein